MARSSATADGQQPARSGDSGASERDSASPPLFGPPERERAEHQRLHVAIGVRPQRRAELRPAMDLRREVRGERRRLLHHRVGGHRCREASRSARDRRPSPARAPRRRPAARRTPPCVLLQQLEVRLGQERRDVVEERRLLARRSGRARETRRACSSLRGRSATAAPRSSPVRVAQADELAELHVRAGRRERPCRLQRARRCSTDRCPCRSRDRRAACSARPAAAARRSCLRSW